MTLSRGPWPSEIRTRILDACRDSSRGSDRAARPAQRGGARALFVLACDQSPTPREEGIQPPSWESRHGLDERFAAGSATVRVVPTQDAAGGMAYSAPRALDAHTGVAWSAPNDSSSSLQSIGETSDLSIVRTLVRVAGPVLEMADGLRALRLNQVRVGDGLVLKLDGRTGRHARCFAILTQRF